MVILPNRIKYSVKQFYLVLFYSFCLLLLSACDSVDDRVDTSGTHQIKNDFYNASYASLKENFITPPEQVKPWVYWYWISDNISKVGIENDLAAMQKAGISTALIGIIHIKGKQGEIKALSEPWWEHVRFAIKKAAEYNIDIGFFNSPGWSQSGGPWVGLDKSMRYLDSKEYHVVGPQALDINAQLTDNFLQNVRVLAFKTPQYEKQIVSTTNTDVSAINPQTGEGLAHSRAENVIDGKKKTVFTIPSKLILNNQKPNAHSSQLQFDFILNQPLEVRTLEIFPDNAFSAQVSLSAKNGDGTFKLIKKFDLRRPRNKPEIGPDLDAPIVVSFPAIRAKHYRISFNKIQLPRNNYVKNSPPGIKEIVLSKGYKLERYVEKKLAKVFPNPLPKFDSYLWPQSPALDNNTMLVQADEVIDITDTLDSGKIKWQAPEGEWTIVHYFMRPTGTKNGPSSHAAKGPEIDKLSKKIAHFHFDSYIGKLIKSMPAKDRTALKYAVVDSYEKGAQNWTDGFADKFEQHYGYDPIPFLPVYSGRVVNSIEQSERFLWDIRRMVADRVAYEYTAGLRERAHQYGLKLWLENYGHWGFPGEFLQYGGQADIVSGEFWASGNLGSIELKAASSAAHIYGHKTVMSESFTSGRSMSFKNHPWDFKKRGDWSFIEGVNHTLLHVYIHQAYDDRFPGVNAWFGSEFNRNNTWFDFMGGWLNYIKRANYMMQQGKYVTDIMYFIGEDAPKMTGEINPSVPTGYSYDFINAEVILNRLTFKDGLYHLPDGMTFSLLVLPNLDNIRPAVLQKIQNLVKLGGAIYGPKPSHSPSLQGFPYADKKIQTLADSLWQNIDGVNIHMAKYGNGYVFYTDDQSPNLSNVLKQIGRSPDLTGLPEEVLWSHRSSDTHDIYFIANQSEDSVNINASFRNNVSHGSVLPPQRWDAVTGKTYKIGQFDIKEGRVNIPMTLKGLQSSFFVFKKQVADKAKSDELSASIIDISQQGQSFWLPSEYNNDGNIVVDIERNGVYQLTNSLGEKRLLNITNIPESILLSQPWHLTFQENRDVPTELTLNALTSLTNLKPLALKYYSGKIIYKTHFDLDHALFKSDQVMQLNLGEVGAIARVKLNNKQLGELWSRPLQVNISEAAKPGMNTLEIEVATTWLNRVLGDYIYPNQFPDSLHPKTFNTNVTFEPKITKTDELQRSGLIGPVTISVIKKVTL